MNKQTLQTTLGCLLHDVGKLVYRASAETGDHSTSGAKWLDTAFPAEAEEFRPVRDCVRYHHAAAIRSTPPAADSPAYIAYIADNIASAADRRQIEDGSSGFNRNMPLSPVFTHLREEGREPIAPAVPRTVCEYDELLDRLSVCLSAIKPEAPWLNSLLAVMEELADNVPSSTNRGESPDISLYDHLKITAAVGACISEYLQAQGEQNLHERLFRREKEFRAEKAFLLYSADFSGIQKFIYTVTTKNALRSLRSRSFFLELTMEHYVDELLELCSLSRANLLYSGGGHCYILLPNTEGVKASVKDWNLHFNEWLFDQFGIALYLADGYTPCSADELTNTPAAEASYKAMFRRVSRAVTAKKQHRYSPAQLIAMNRRSGGEVSRECRICGRTDKLTEDWEGGTYVCPVCRSFEELSQDILSANVFLTAELSVSERGFTLPRPDGSECRLVFTDEKKTRTLLNSGASVLRVYTKNEGFTGLSYATKLYVGDYAYSNLMEELVDNGDEGVSRIAVCRMDADDLGEAFVSGFEHTRESDPESRYHYVTISRTAAFSRQMSRFFKREMNSILGKGTGDALHVAIVYSGGDDAFLIGAWQDVIEAALRVQERFECFTYGRLTLSAGVGLFGVSYPVRQAANETALLEAASKKMPGKNSITLFDANAGHTYSWDDFRKRVIAEKKTLLERFFAAEEQQERGNAFLYHIVELLRSPAEGGTKGLNIARLAYMLSRLEPSQQDARHKLYEEFSHTVLSWAVSEKDRRELITAIYIYVYSKRKRGD